MGHDRDRYRSLGCADAGIDRRQDGLRLFFVAQKPNHPSGTIRLFLTPFSIASEAAFLSGAVRVSRSGVVGIVRPFALNLPLRAVGETDQRRAEGPRALIAIFLT